MKTYATRECTAHADVHYPIKNTNHVTTAVLTTQNITYNIASIHTSLFGQVGPAILLERKRPEPFETPKMDGATKEVD